MIGMLGIRHGDKKEMKASRLCNRGIRLGGPLILIGRSHRNLPLGTGKAKLFPSFCNFHMANKDPLPQSVFIASPCYPVRYSSRHADINIASVLVQFLESPKF